MIPIWVQGVIVLVCFVLLLVLLGILLSLAVNFFRPNVNTPRRTKLYARGFWAAVAEVVLMVLNLAVSISQGGSVSPSDAVKELWGYAS